MKISDFPYIDRNDYFLYNLDNYNFSHKEILIIMFLNLYDKNHLTINYEEIAKKLKLSVTEVDEIIISLIEKDLVVLEVFDSKVRYNTENLLSIEKKEDEEADSDFSKLLSLCEEVFNRPLNTTEMQTLSELTEEYSKEKIEWALREAEVYQKGNATIYYVKGVLKNHDNEQES